jgi:alanine-glyoxylate transaminase/serine-glyoxylate transaminase/serine-pyruvate transaminase
MAFSPLLLASLMPRPFFLRTPCQHATNTAVHSAKTQEGHILPQLNAVFVPAGIDDAAVRAALLNRFGIEIGAGLGAYKGKVWRIGLMGYASRPANVLLFLSALEQLLAEQGLKFNHGSSIAAANAAYCSK